MRRDKKDRKVFKDKNGQKITKKGPNQGQSGKEKNDRQR